MKPASFAHLILAAAAFAGTFRTESANAADLILDNGGLKNTYRLVFSEFAPREEFVSGSFEILSDETDRKIPHTKIPFYGTIKPGENDPATGGERIELRVSPLVTFYPPPEPTQPSPAISGWIYGRDSASPGVTLEIWTFDTDAGKWAKQAMAFGNVPGEGGTGWLSGESLGGIALDMPEQAVRKAVTSRLYYGEEFEEGATGLMVQEWIAPDQGLKLMMGAEPGKSPKNVTAITISGKSKWKTARGIGIGDTRAEVIKRYGKVINEEEAEQLGSENTIVAGSIYGGLIFTFGDSGKVTEIFLGAAAE